MFQAFLTFETFIFPRIATVLYWIGLVLIILGTVIGAIGSLFTEAGFIGFLIALIGGIIGLVVFRVTVELWMVLFSILDTLKQIRDRR
jgi:uncharacterized membrane protein YeaQ/YmgE (transglycosylase-associated protein family)